MKKSVEELIERFVIDVDLERLVQFLSDVIPLVELYAIEEGSDWVLQEVGELNERNVRLIRTVYIMSKIAENHSGMLASIRARYPRLYEKIQKEAELENG